MARIPRSHPRRESLLVRGRLARGFGAGLVASEGLMAHGRGEALDYLLGERTGPAARRALRAAAAELLLAERPVISVNGNVAAICPREAVAAARASGARVEVNLFYGGRRRELRIARELRRCGAAEVLGTGPRRRRLGGTDSPRRRVDADGIFAADLVVVPLEDGDRAGALRAAGKRVVAFDLNPMSRTARAAHVTVVDNVSRGMGALAALCAARSSWGRARLARAAAGFDNAANLAAAVGEIRANLARRMGGCAAP